MSWQDNGALRRADKRKLYELGVRAAAKDRGSAHTGHKGRLGRRLESILKDSRAGPRSEGRGGGSAWEGVAAEPREVIDHPEALQAIP